MEKAGYKVTYLDFHHTKRKNINHILFFIFCGIAQSFTVSMFYLYNQKKKDLMKNITNLQIFLDSMSGN